MVAGTQKARPITALHIHKIVIQLQLQNKVKNVQSWSNIGCIGMAQIPSLLLKSQKSPNCIEDVLIFQSQNLRCVLIELRLDMQVYSNPYMDLHNQLSVICVLCVDLLVLIFFTQNIKNIYFQLVKVIMLIVMN